jgi:predicted porin
MMKKTTSALAVAALLGTGAASAATFQVNDNTSFGVAANIGYTYVSSESLGGTTENSLNNNSSDLRFSGESVSANGLTTTLYVELDGWGNDDGQTTGITQDQMYVGLGGDFGTVELGTDIGTYGAVDGLKDIDWWSGVSGLGNDDDNMVRYTFPAMGNLSASVGANVYDDGDDGTRSGTTVHGSISYDLGVVALSAAYDNGGGLTGNDEEPFYGVGAQFDLAGVDTRITYESDSDPDTEVDMLSITGIYSYGPGYVYGVAQSVSGDTADDIGQLLNIEKPAGTDNFDTNADDSITQYNVGVAYNVTDNMTVYAEATRFGRSDDAGDQNSIGVNVSF